MAFLGLVTRVVYKPGDMCVVLALPKLIFTFFKLITISNEQVRSFCAREGFRIYKGICSLISACWWYANIYTFKSSPGNALDGLAKPLRKCTDIAAV